MTISPLTETQVVDRHRYRQLVETLAASDCHPNAVQKSIAVGAGFTRADLAQHVSDLKGRRLAYSIREKNKNAAASDPAAAALLVEAEGVLDDRTPGVVARLKAAEVRSAAAGKSFRQAVADLERLEAKNDRQIRPAKLHGSRVELAAADDRWAADLAAARRQFDVTRAAMFAASARRAKIESQILNFNFHGEEHATAEAEPADQTPAAAASVPGSPVAGGEDELARVCVETSVVNA